MSGIIKQYEQSQIKILTQEKEIPRFRSGDTIKVSVKVIDGNSERLQAYEGIVIAKRNRGLASSCVVRKISHGEGVERRFLIYSPNISKISVIKRGVVRRAKLFYLRGLSGKAARIREKKDYASARA